mgnify:CR=1 FL=1
MPMKYFVFCLLSFFIALSTFSQSSPAGYVVSSSNCASGGDDYYFFANKEVVRVWALGGSPNPIDGGLEKGTWKLNSKGEVEMSFQKTISFSPAKNAKVVAVAAQTIYDLYEAKIIQNNDNKPLTISVNVKEDEDGCGHTYKHPYQDADTFFQDCLKSSVFKRQYAFTSSKILTKQDLASYSKAQLEIMRNELFAQYNYAFKNPKWKKYFKEKGAGSGIVNAEILLSETEKSNLALIKTLEAKKKK